MPCASAACPSPIVGQYPMSFVELNTTPDRACCASMICRVAGSAVSIVSSGSRGMASLLYVLCAALSRSRERAGVSVPNVEYSIVNQACFPNVDRQRHQHCPRELLDLLQRIGISDRYVVDTRQWLLGDEVAQRGCQTYTLAFALDQVF